MDRGALLIALTLAFIGGAILYRIAPVEVEICTPNLVQDLKYQQAVRDAARLGLAIPFNDPLAQEALRPNAPPPLR